MAVTWKTASAAVCIFEHFVIIIIIIIIRRLDLYNMRSVGVYDRIFVAGQNGPFLTGS